MSNVAEGCAGRRRIGAIDKEHVFSGFGQRPGDGTPHNACANDRNVRRGREPMATALDAGRVPTVANDGDFVVTHLRLAHRGS
jgi:hypothetical protein